jgi:putative membrane protein
MARLGTVRGILGDAMSTPSSDHPPDASERKGFYVRGWVLAVVAVVVVAAAAVAIGFAVSDGGDGDHRGFGRAGGPFGEHHDGGGHGFGILALLVLIALVVAVVVLVVRHFRTQPHDVKSSAEELLAERFARGEIDEADYLSRRNALRS